MPKPNDATTVFLVPGETCSKPPDPRMEHNWEVFASQNLFLLICLLGGLLELIDNFSLNL